MKVVIIGTGNVATVLGKKIQGAGNEIIQVVGRNFEKTSLLASHLGCTAIFNTRYISLLADIYIIAVSDSSIHSVAAGLQLKDKIIVHSAAAVSKSVLATCSQNFGVLYPLQSLVKDMPSLPTIPILVDGNNETTIKTLFDFSTEWAENVYVVSDDERLKLHVAAVLVSNFTNYLFTLTEEYCRKEQLNFRLLHTLIEETITRIKDKSPFALQTGPAVREDYATIEKHIEILASHPEQEEIYNLLSKSIISFYNKSK